MIDADGKINQNALKIRITDNYLEALSRIYNEVKVLGLPGGRGGSSVSESGNPLSAETLATAMVLSNHISGKSGGSGQLSSAEVQTL